MNNINKKNPTTLTSLKHYLVVLVNANKPSTSPEHRYSDEGDILKDYDTLKNFKNTEIAVPVFKSIKSSKLLNVNSIKTHAPEEIITTIVDDLSEQIRDSISLRTIKVFLVLNSYNFRDNYEFRIAATSQSLKDRLGVDGIICSWYKNVEKLEKRDIKCLEKQEYCCDCNTSNSFKNKEGEEHYHTCIPKLLRELFRPSEKIDERLKIMLKAGRCGNWERPTIYKN